MIRTLNFLCVAIMGLTCLGLYQIAEEARVMEAELQAARNAIRHEEQSIAVLGAEWTVKTQPKRIHALARKLLSFSGKAPIQLSSLAQLPRKGENDGQVMFAKAGGSQGSQPRAVAFAPQAVR